MTPCCGTMLITFMVKWRLFYGNMKSMTPCCGTMLITFMVKWEQVYDPMLWYDVDHFYGKMEVIFMGT